MKGTNSYSTDNYLGAAFAYFNWITPEISSSFLFRVCQKRAEFIKLNITQHAVLFLSYLCTSPGDLVMYLYYMKYVATQHSYEVVDTHKIACMLPQGFLSSKSLDELWTAQKVEGANLLDMISFEE